jgi:putative transposase
VEALEEALSKGRPDIFNTDQGSQFTGKAFIGILEKHGIKISMDGKGSYRDNLFIERLWRTVKYEEVYLKAYQNGKDARTGISDYFRFYNTARPHQALGYRTPGDVFTSTPFEESEKGVIESLTQGTVDTAGHYLNLAPLLS